jgi:acetyl-CoA acyltransferase
MEAQERSRMQMRTAVIVDAARSPMAKGRAPREGRPGGALSGLHPAELLGQVFAALVGRNDFDPGEVDDVIVGCVSQVAEQAGPVGRWAWLGAGLPEHVPSTTVDRRCGSSQQAVDFAAMGVMTGVYDIAVAAGVESMSRVPMFTARMGKDPIGPSATARYAPGLVPQGISSELIARDWGLSRHDLDVFAARSQQAAAATDLSAEIVPITVPGNGAGPQVVDADETIRPQTTVEALAELKPAFDQPEYRERFPDLGWHTTAGNSSQLADGASALLVMSEEKAAELGLRPRARIHAMAVASADPILMLTGPIPATEKVLARTGMSVGDFDHIEVNEAFAPVPLAWREHFGADLEKINPRGGAIALGHPLGASGGRLMTTLLHGLEAGGGRWGLQTMCEAGGMANATIIERV